MASSSGSVGDEPSRPSSKRHNDGSKITATNPNSAAAGVNIVDIDIDISKLVDNPTRYAAIIVPKSLLPSINALIERASTKIDDAPSSFHIEGDETCLEDKQSQFLQDFGKLKNDMVAALEKFNEDDLKQKVGQRDFEQFKIYRKDLTKWFNTCQHLKNRLTHSSTSNQFLKMRYDISPAVEDAGVKDSCLNKLKHTRESLESTLTHSVVNKALDLNETAKATFISCQFDKEADKILMKALRVVLRVNGERGPRRGQDPKYDPSVARRRWRGEGNRPRPRREFKQSYRRRFSSRYERQFPPLRRQNFSYRRFKRRSSHFQEDDDDVFENDDEGQRPFRPFRRRTFRNRNYRW
jgi:hypothetical protein